MGAINYYTSDYITLGVKPYDVQDFERDKEFTGAANDEIAEYGGTLEECIYNEIQSNYEADESNVSYILEKYSFYYYHVVIEPGYYEGFTLDIENNFSVAYDSWEDKRAAQKELTQLRKCLLECAGVGLVKCCPGWCTVYYNYEETCKAINAAINDMRTESKETPTWSRYNRNIYTRRGC